MKQTVRSVGGPCAVFCLAYPLITCMPGGMSWKAASLFLCPVTGVSRPPAAVRQVGGWKDVLGEDIVLTYQLLEKGFGSEYQAAAVGYTTVPETISGLYNQRKRWAAGMLEGLSTVRPWQQGSIYSRHFSLVNLSVIWLDLAFLFGFVPGLVLAALGYFYLAGCLTLTTLAVCLVFFLSTYLYQKQLHIPFYNSVWGFVWFLALFQMIQSTAAIHGYLLRLLHRKGEWK